MPRLPNLLVMCVSHSGSTVTMRMLGAAGWHIWPEGSHEDPNVLRALSSRERSRHDVRRALRGYLASRAEPWAVKAVELCFAAEWLWPAFEGFERKPVLVWLTRSLADVEDSHRRRNKFYGGAPGLPHLGTVQQLWKGAEQQFSRWPGDKLRVSFEQIEKVCAIFDPTQIYSRNHPLPPPTK